MSQRVPRTRAHDERNGARAEMTGSAISGFWLVSILHIASLMGATCSFCCRLICLKRKDRVALGACDQLARRANQ